MPTLSEHESKTLLARYDVPIAAERLALTRGRLHEFRKRSSRFAALSAGLVRTFELKHGGVGLHLVTRFHQDSRHLAGDRRLGAREFQASGTAGGGRPQAGPIPGSEVFI